ncbi:MAG: zinc metallopeptidase [Pseudomonadota bacterium]
MGYVIIFFVLLGLIVGPGIWVKRVLARYSEPKDRYSGTGAELARHLLDVNGLQSVGVEVTEMGDHYDPRDKTVRLTEDKYNGRSLTAITVAAHEVGHAVQDRDKYTPLRLRGILVTAAQRFQKIGAAVLILAPLVSIVSRVPMVGVIMLLGGFLTLASSALVHLVTLPTEFDASFGRALPMLDEHGILIEVDRPHARKLLKAAALTYVSASLMSLVSIARWFAILRT